MKKETPEWQKQVLTEQAELRRKIDSLRDFLTSENYYEVVPEKYDRYLLEEQYSFMRQYENFLIARIERFK